MAQMPFSIEIVNRDSLGVGTGLDLLNVTGITHSLFCFVQYLWPAHKLHSKVDALPGLTLIGA